MKLKLIAVSTVSGIVYPAITPTTIKGEWIVDTAAPYGFIKGRYIGLQHVGKAIDLDAYTQIKHPSIDFSFYELKPKIETPIVMDEWLIRSDDGNDYSIWVEQGEGIYTAILLFEQCVTRTWHIEGAHKRALKEYSKLPERGELDNDSRHYYEVIKPKRKRDC